MRSKDGAKRTPLGKPRGVGGVEGKMPYGQPPEALGLITCFEQMHHMHVQLETTQWQPTRQSADL